MTEAAIRERIRQHLENLRGWREPDGHLVPTEPDPEDRALVRAGLRAAVHELESVLEVPRAHRRSARW